jgi:hypothetical protein
MVTLYLGQILISTGEDHDDVVGTILILCQLMKRENSVGHCQNSPRATTVQKNPRSADCARITSVNQVFGSVKPFLTE